MQKSDPARVSMWPDELKQRLDETTKWASKAEDNLNAEDHPFDFVSFEDEVLDHGGKVADAFEGLLDECPWRGKKPGGRVLKGRRI